MNGILVVNKEKGYTSRDVVNIINKKFNTFRVGHTGTLDPLAEGVLVLALGNALKIVDLLTMDTKEYIAVAQLGISTDTLDITGNILNETKDFNINEKVLRNVLFSFLGTYNQEVPLYSSIKVKGKRLYDYAREGKSIELPKRNVNILEIELLELSSSSFKFRVVVSKGTYIRSLIRDIGNSLGIDCTMKELTRTKQGNFKIEDSYTIEEIKNDNYKIIPIVDCIDGFEKVVVDDRIKEKVLNGRILENRYKTSRIAYIDKDNNVLGFYKPYEKDLTKVKPIKIIGNN